MTPMTMHAQPATAESIAPYGTLLEGLEDGVAFGAQDAPLQLDQGTPRFYVMRLHARPMVLDRLTQHRHVTQCLAALQGQPWLIVMAPPGEAPDLSQTRAFWMRGDQALAMKVGTWHAGPYVLQSQCDFVNLELADTNVVDHHTVVLDTVFGLTYEATP